MVRGAPTPLVMVNKPAGTKDDRIDLGRLRWRDRSALRGGKGRVSDGAIRHRRGVPVGPVFQSPLVVEFPGRAPGVGDGVSEQ